VSNRGHNSIAVFRVDPQDGTLTLAQSILLGGETPRSFALDSNGTFLIAMMQRSGTIIPLRIDAQNGELATAGDPLQLSRPVCAVFLPI
jgi:6-phosphogluconolactonase